MKRFNDIDQVRRDLKSVVPLNDIIEMVDGIRLERVNDELYKKRCDLDDHPQDDDGTRDSTASFTVCPQKELWYCFGCGTGGDRFEYVQRKLHIDHIEAIYKVAELCGFDLTPYFQERTQEQIIEDSLFQENDMAREQAHIALLNDQRALQYLLGRGISLESIKEFKLGYVPQITGSNVTFFENIPNHLGLHLDRRDQYIDAILFPVTDVYGRMRYFQSRPFTPMTGMKYIGASEKHPLYNETDRLYGFPIARKKIRNLGGKLIGVEGAPDTIVCNQHGIPAVGFLGTAVNQKTFEMLDKFKVAELVLLLDGDKAGRDRSFKICEKYLTFSTQVRLRVAMLPDGDPDELINEHGAQFLIDIINKSKYAIQHILDHIWWNGDYQTPTGKIEYMITIQKYINLITDKFIRKVIIHDIADKMGFDPTEIEDYYLQNTAQTGVSLYSPDGEEILLGEAIRNPDFIIELGALFKNEDWYLARHKALFNILRQADPTTIDPDTLYTQAKNIKLDHIIKREWLVSLINKHGNVEFNLVDVHDKLMRRKVKDQIIRLDQHIMDMATKPELIVDQSMGKIYNIVTKQGDNGIYDGEGQVMNVMSLIHERMKNPGAIIGYDLGSGFQKLTRALLGLQTKTLTIVAANQSVGKTQICQNWALNLALSEVPTLWFSFEMDVNRMTFRNLAILTGLPLMNVMTGNMSMEDKVGNLDKWAARLANSPLHISERGTELTEAISIARRHVMKHHVKVIFVDYLQLQYVAESKYSQQRHRELGVISKAWKEFAKETDTAVVGISQLSKAALDAVVAKAEHGSGSYEIAQDSDNYITLKEKDQDEIDKRGIQHGNITMNIDKNRMGEADVLIDVYSDRPTQRMQEVY